MPTSPEVLNEIDELIRLVEEDIPANPLSRRNKSRERHYRAIISDYFNQLGKSFPYASLDSIYNRYTESTTIKEVDPTPDEIDWLVDSILTSFRSRVLTDLTGEHRLLYLDGAAQVTAWGKTKRLRIPIAYEGPPFELASSYAERHAALLVTEMEIETKKQLAQVISQAIDNKRGVPGLARDIRHQFENMGRARSQVIARTETCDALQQGFLDRSKQMGINGKEWVVTIPCEICAPNADIKIPLEGTFPSGHSRPPAHPNCRCALAPVILEVGTNAV